MASRDEILHYCNDLLQPQQYNDVALNGLQIEGRSEIERIAVAVSSNQRTIDAAINQQADAILVHHGLVLNDRVGHIVGPVRNRLRSILANDINLIAYHLPLDGHPEVGNNARIIEELNCMMVEPLEIFGPAPVGYIAEPDGPRMLDDLMSGLHDLTEQEPVLLSGGPQIVEKIAVLSGSGYPALEEASTKGCQALITGDAREPTMAIARELGISVLVGGHEATERLGVQSLAHRLQTTFGVESTFVPDPNPL